MRLTTLALTLCLLPPTHAVAQDHLRPADVLNLAELAHLDAADMADHLSGIAPHFRTTLSPRFDSIDPFLWVLNAEFGAEGFSVPAGLVHCARYGLDTRDLLGAHRASDPSVFRLGSALRVGSDDSAVWPEEAVALLRCSFSWDDARRLAPWVEADPTTAIADLFEDISRTDDAIIRAEAGDHIRAQYGPDGFALLARNGPRRSFAWLESFSVTRQITHQRVSIRVFLIGGSV